MALIEVSKSTVSWSMLPFDGMGLHLCLKLGWEVSIRSKVFSLRVGKSTFVQDCCLQQCRERSC